ncbi:MAG TPA: hypothetical protein VH328_14760 [Burkholderiaceae bacterium]|nr:hypothetical protein [Burkholderiaceae bacterium]
MLGTHTTGVLTQLAEGLDGPRKVAVQAAATSILGAVNEMADAWYPELAKVLMAWKFDGRFVVHDDAGAPTPPRSMAAVREHAQDYAATRMVTSVLPELFNVLARVHDRWGLAQGLPAARLAIGDFSLLLGGALALAMLSPIKTQLFKESREGASPDAQGLLGSDGVLACIASCLDRREGHLPDFAQALEEVRRIEARSRAGIPTEAGMDSP